MEHRASFKVHCIKHQTEVNKLYIERTIMVMINNARIVMAEKLFL